MPPKKTPPTSPVKSPVKAQTQEDTDICQTYIKMDQREHVLNLPDTYIGSIEKSETELWIYDKNENKIVKKTTSIVPGFYKIFDEILVNAYDQYVRTGTVKEIRVEITPDYISVMNDGDGIDVEIHPEHDVYIPELLFGNLLTSANYHQTNKITGGKNGLGSKVTNIFSRRFIVETVDAKRKRYFRQEFSNNMLEKTEPVVEKYTKKSFTKITFYPDYPRFHMDGLDDDIEGLLLKRVYDMAAITDKSVSVYLNEQKIELKDFESYVDLYIGAKSETKRVHEEMGERWEVVVCDSNDDKMEQVSFVNGIYTWKGGKHIEALATTISTKLAKYVEGRGKKKIQLKPSVIRDNMWIFAKTTIEDPSFDSQTKEYLTTPPAKFGSKFTVSDKFIEKIAKLDIVEKAIRLSEFKDSKILTKTDGKKTNHIRGIPKLDDANWAGTPLSSQCTLILTEGDSAKAFAIAGLSIIGRDKYGVFPLRGKLLNVREAPDEKVSKNEEIKNLKIILGLQQGKEYETAGDLRYGSIMILTDADVDGSHIKGLLINLFHNFWPSLLKQDGFIKSMMTPIVKAKKRDDVRVFYTLTEYEAWKASPDSAGYEIKYYKGLGTSTSTEAKEYFKDLDKSEIRYLWNEDTAVDISVNLAFHKDKANDRKQWLLNYDRTSIIEQTQKDIPIEDFINKDLIHFSKYDCERSVPCIVDGYKPSQRKVLYGALLRNLKKSVKVAQFAAYVAEKSAYHHGEQSLNECIIAMAQDYVGSNNMNYLEPEGNFGCLSPETEILMWNGSIKQAQHIEVNDELIGDDGNKRIVLQITSGIDDMYKITNCDGLNMIVNSEHILTLYYIKQFEITWKESDSSWYFIYFNGKILKQYSIEVNQNISNDDHFNRSKISKKEGYDMIMMKKKEIETIYGTSKVIDIKLKDYMKLSTFNKRSLYQISNQSSINWDKKPVPIDPYIFGCWIGDGDHTGIGITSIDKEIIHSFVKYAKTINCEITHHKNKNHDGYHYTIRRSGSGKLVSIGSNEHSYETCIGCQTSSKPINPDICNWKFNEELPIILDDEFIDMCNKKRINPFVTILKNNSLFRNKNVPDEYIYNDEETRLQFLAGFIDTDGRILNNGSAIISYEISQSERTHANLIYSTQKIANSLGFSTNIYHTKRLEFTKKNELMNMLTLRIFGDDLHRIPIKLERKRAIYYGKREKILKHFTKFKIEYIGKDKFNGFQLDKNERFLLANFTVTHNSRLVGGEDHASPRYIFTKMSELCEMIFHPSDSPLLDYMDDDGEQIEPEFYVPVIPNILVNGCKGIGTGFSTTIPSYNPLDIIANLRRKMRDETMIEMKPWFRGFIGKIEKVGDKYVSKGLYRVIDTSRVEVYELPIGMWTDKYKEHLEDLMNSDKDGKKKKQQILLKYESQYTESVVKFILHFDKTELATMLNKGTFEKDMKLIDSGNTNTSNMHLFNEYGQIKKYDSPAMIIEEFYEIRKKYYVKRKAYLENKLNRELELFSARVRFILAILNDEIILKGKDEEALDAELETRGYPKFTKGKLEFDPKSENENPSYDYLTSMPIRSMTQKRLEELMKQLDERKILFENLKKQSIYDLWNADLDELERTYKKHLGDYNGMKGDMQSASSSMSKPKKRATKSA